MKRAKNGKLYSFVLISNENSHPCDSPCFYIFAIFSLKFYMKINDSHLKFSPSWLRLSILHDYSISLCLYEWMRFECLIKTELPHIAMKADFSTFGLAVVARVHDYDMWLPGGRSGESGMMVSIKHKTAIFNPTSDACGASRKDEMRLHQHFPTYSWRKIIWIGVSWSVVGTRFITTLAQLGAVCRKLRNLSFCLPVTSSSEGNRSEKLFHYALLNDDSAHYTSLRSRNLRHTLITVHDKCQLQFVFTNTAKSFTTNVTLSPARLTDKFNSILIIPENLGRVHHPPDGFYVLFSGEIAKIVSIVACSRGLMKGRCLWRASSSHSQLKGVRCYVNIDSIHCSLRSRGFLRFFLTHEKLSEHCNVNRNLLCFILFRSHCCHRVYTSSGK